MFENCFNDYYSHINKKLEQQQLQIDNLENNINSQNYAIRFLLITVAILAILQAIEVEIK